MFLIKHFVTSSIHLGHEANKWNPKTAHFLFAIGVSSNSKGMHLIDLEQTFIMMRRALAFIRKLTQNRGYLLCISSVTHKVLYLPAPGFAGGQGPLVDSHFRLSSSNEKKEHTLPPRPPATQRRGISESRVSEFQRDSSTISTHNIPSKRLLSESRPDGHHLGATRLKSQRDFGETDSRSVLDQSSFQTDVGILSRSELFDWDWEKSANTPKIPQAILIFNLMEAKPYVRQAMKFGIPVIGILDSNSNPFGIQYPIPGNDDSLDAIDLYLKWIRKAIWDAKRKELSTFAL